MNGTREQLTQRRYSAAALFACLFAVGFSYPVLVEDGQPNAGGSPP